MQIAANWLPASATVIDTTAKTLPANADVQAAVEKLHTLPEGTPQGTTAQTVEYTDEERTQWFKTHISDPLNNARTSLETIKVRLDALQKKLNQQRPDLAHAQWDFALKGGKLSVVSNDLSDQDKAWLEGRLNADKTMQQAARTFSDAAIGRYQQTPDNLRVATRFNANNEYATARQQIDDGALRLKAIMADSTNLGRRGQQKVDDGHYYNAIFVVGDYLTPTKIDTYA
ncbi:hypothetical protein SAMN02745857_02766 [Andreprevotia lacus DSM 23236]|jgi:hypothetical protein|uniref:Uncharacterized protein n=1 Tax=Andreprevotia lacus DSM 23236 TaxID=1121001 RepID=A0A1W1XTF8_9NEIS|nr:hypothetical protein [Andreprevotia lacus]SMC27249.1 hypothetical protein SAMN02745857_02766 [Andreprevotia lacus DSM 23236]